ncbi:UDPGP type 1 family protein [Opitutaceae bacterium]|nr:UDPGP type 1 family protein [Opitutaceae bacterium]
MSSLELIESYRAAGQGHVFTFFEHLSESEQQQLLSEAAEIDLHEILALKRDLIDGDGAAAMDYTGLTPSPFEVRPEKGGNATAWAEAERLGEEALRSGRVAAFTVAGGQGTRLGFDGPKGTFPITPVRNATLFQVFAEKIASAAKRYAASIPWLIMTSHQNHEATVSFFVENDYFGLAESQVRFFRQGRMPAVDPDGKIMLASRSSIAMSPDGHGGSLRALDRSGALAQLEAEGIDTISYFQVDNPLVRCIDPAFIGWHLKSQSEMSSKMVPKAYAEEKVGHFCMQGDRAVVVEYSDLPAAMQAETDAETGELRFIAGSIAIHVLDRNFVKRLAGAGPEAALPFHLARKEIPTIDGAGDSITPTEPNGIKFEMFVFDALPFAKNPIVIETLRENDFSPVKNATGVDSADSCRADLLRQYTRWANANNAGVGADETGLPSFDYEVCPSFGYDEASFAERWGQTSPSPSISAGAILA